MRDFVGSNGRVIEAEFLGFNEATQIVNIRLRDGREQNVRLDLFSAACQQWIKAGGQQGDDPFGDVVDPQTAGRPAGERKVLTINDIEYAFRWCPPGTFTMGSPVNEQGRNENERQHRVTLTRGFWMLETEVTQEMWESVMDDNPSEIKGDKLPVYRVSRNDCLVFVRLLNVLRAAPEGYRFSLPTEAQWEYACRAGTTTAFHFGNTLSREQANIDNNMRPSDVKTYRANAWGLYDMHGNVMEWVLDWHGEYPSGAVTDPVGQHARVGHPTDARGILRGGSMNFGPPRARSAARWHNVPTHPGASYGLRLALVPAE